MKKFMKKALSICLAVLLVVSVSAVCFAAAPEGKKYYDYNGYVLLGDSIASGWSDVEDRETRFVRVENSYGAYLADDLGLTDSYYPMACIGFRTVEMRYILEEDFQADEYLYYSIDKEKMDTVYAPAMREAIANNDLITLNIGGNDWGSYLGWHVFDIMDDFEETNEEFLTEARAYLETAGVARDTVETLATIASASGCLPTFIKVLPVALNEGLTGYFENWNHMIEDIYALNPDVTLVVIGMFDTSLQAESTADGGLETTISALNIGQTISDIANIPMAQGAEKYGYIFVEPKNIECEKQHPSAVGHRQIADLILEELPDADFPYADVQVGSLEYKAIEYMYENSIMPGISETEFGPDKAITKAQLSEAIFNICGKDDIVAESDTTVKRVDMALAVFKASTAVDSGFMGIIKAFSRAFDVLFKGGIIGFGAEVTRAEAAQLLYDIAK